MNIREIKMLISDVDGVWTDGSFYKGTDNIELKKFSVFDGVGVAMARAAKIKIALISSRASFNDLLLMSAGIFSFFI